MASLRICITQAFHKHPRLFALSVISAVALIAFGNALPNSFHFDDIVGVVRNPAIRDLKYVPAYFTDPSTFGLGRTREWRPILQITYALNYAVAGFDPVVFRCFNLLSHLGTAFLIFLIVTRILERFPESLHLTVRVPTHLPGLLAGGLFVVHTANSEAVDYIWARSSVLATFFYLTAFYAYLRGPFGGSQPSRILWHLTGVVFFGFAMGTKATAVTLPATLLLYEILFLNPAAKNPLRLFLSDPGRLRKYFPLAVVLLAYLAVRIVLLPRMFTSLFSAPTPKLSSYSYLLTQFRAWVYYIKLFLWPYPLIADHPGFGWSHSILDMKVLLSLGFVLAILIAAWHVRKTNPLTSFFTFWYFTALLPEASFIPLEDAVVGYRAYPAYVGLAVVAVLLSFRGFESLARVTRARANTSSSSLWLPYAALASVVVATLTATTVVRNRDWRDETTLWSDVLNKEPTNPRAYMFLGAEFLGQGDYGKAQEFLDRATQLGPSTSHARILRGYLNVRLDRNQEALSDYAKALELDPRSPYAFFYRGELYRKLSKSDEALADYHAALNYMPYLTDAYLGIAMAYLDKNELGRATDACAKLVNIDPEDGRGYDCLGTLLVEQGRLADAVTLYKQGIGRFPGDGELWHSLGAAYAKYGRNEEADQAFRTATRLKSETKPQSPKTTPLLK